MDRKMGPPYRMFREGVRDRTAALAK